MEHKDFMVFKRLFAEAQQQCFSELMTRPLTETESKLFHNRIFDATGLTVGWRSLKNYSIYVIEGDSKRAENPSTATLDTLARFLLKAPLTNEIKRKENEGHYPYWFGYKAQFLKSGFIPADLTDHPLQEPVVFNFKRLLAILLLLCLLVVTYLIYNSKQSVSFSDDFKEIGTSKLTAHGWMIKNEDQQYWAKRNLIPGKLTLYTLPGDDWPDSTGTALGVKNLLIRKIPFDCFTTDLQIAGFIPKAEWQQAGLLLLSDTTLNGPHLRLSLAFNDNFGGYHRPNEIILQGIFSTGIGKPEEFIHFPILTLDSTARIPSLFNNFRYSSLRINKTGNHYRILYANGERIDAAYKEIGAKDIKFEPRYLAIFALKGNKTTSQVMPVQIHKLSIEKQSCD